MSLTRSISYDGIMSQVLPIAKLIIAEGVAKNIIDQSIYLTQLIDDIKTVKSTENDPDKLNVLKDAESFVSHTQWTVGLLNKKTLPSLAYSIASLLLWSSMPRRIVDNRSLFELAKDILSKVEMGEQYQDNKIL